jgi:hypothetical protein
MPTLHIALQDGFTGESVIVRVNGAKVFQQPAVRTRFQIGLAERFEVEVATPVAEVEVEVPAKGRRSLISVPFDIPEKRWLGISIGADGTLTHQIAKEDFGYV